jgi:hypothetical protein
MFLQEMLMPRKLQLSIVNKHWPDICKLHEANFDFQIPRKFTRPMLVMMSTFMANIKIWNS